MLTILKSLGILDCSSAILCLARRKLVNPEPGFSQDLFPMSVIWWTFGFLADVACGMVSSGWWTHSSVDYTLTLTFVLK